MYLPLLDQELFIEIKDNVKILKQKYMEVFFLNDYSLKKMFKNLTKIPR